MCVAGVADAVTHGEATSARREEASSRGISVAEIAERAMQTEREETRWVRGGEDGNEG